ncbi:hypothetical protein KP509_17G005400 [Ceratopteris richardii]|uniref:Uncharacterized protein n=1 Tax=Ceratopteris richardii TaxID=49495 RepID=A0A8T2STQ3_CERRI|nr:hypothetical protein KP509_17G005400 [Ceratopteris richardii]
MEKIKESCEVTNPIHNEAPEKTIFLLLDHPSGDANTTGTPTTNRNDVATMLAIPTVCIGVLGVDIPETQKELGFTSFFNWELNP